MVHLFGLETIFRGCGSKKKVLLAKQLAENEFSIHAGQMSRAESCSEPELVPESYKSAPSLTEANFADLVRIAKADKWPEYFRSATAGHRG